MNPFAEHMLVDGPGTAALFAYGTALLRNGEHDRAIEQFNRLVDHPGISPTDVEHTVVHIWLGRAYAAAGKPDAARREYDRFFALWQADDTDVPLYNDARAEVAKLGGAGTGQRTTR